MNIDILGISELKWTGMSEFNSDDHYIYHCGQESLRINGGAWWAAVCGVAQSRIRLKQLSSSSSSRAFWELFLTLRDIPFLLRDSCPQ